MRTSRAALALPLALAAVLGLSACAGDDAPEETTSASTSVEKPATEETPAEEETEAGSAATGDKPAWGASNEVVGTKLGTAEGDGFTVDVYQVSTATATKTGQFADESGKPILNPGDPLVFVNYVLTNTGDADLPLSYTIVGVDARYADWPYMQGMDSIVDSALFEAAGVVDSPIAPGSGEAPFVLAPGQSVAYGENFKHQPGSPIEFEVTLTPADAAGDLVHDLRQEVTLSATIA
ncbi:hypothetical protein ACFP63_00585 [Oerskovia jenensis]|uniref:DUF4352 domain-containing protein n=1 Tax=Oerskovia jenensis TaxID=162169 RepID=A0ABS2LF03_9CELL|nr:hypothetical protein [Oerskovia jenensis]MBM7479001.1 hypothetical protein [Oerskovia jenensis]